MTEDEVTEANAALDVLEEARQKARDKQAAKAKAKSMKKRR